MYAPNEGPKIFKTIVDIFKTKALKNEMEESVLVETYRTFIPRMSDIHSFQCTWNVFQDRQQADT